MARRDWFRVRVRWYTDPDHADLSGDALNIGPLLMMLADGDPAWRETGEADLRESDGRPVTPRSLSTHARWTAQRCSKALAELVRVKTLSRRHDGVYFFRNYRKHQEDPSAERKRKERESHASVRGQSAGMSREKKKQKREAEAELTPPAPQGANGRAKRSRGFSDDEVARILTALREAQQQLDSGKAGPRDTPGNRKMVNRPRADHNATVDDWLAVIAAQLESVRRDRDAWRYLSLSTLSRRENFSRLMEQGGGGGESKPEVRFDEITKTYYFVDTWGDPHRCDADGNVT